MKRLKYLALAIAMLSQSSFAMQAEEAVRTAKHFINTVRSWREAEEIIQTFRDLHGAGKECPMVVVDFDDVCVKYLNASDNMGALVEPCILEILPALEAAGWRILGLTARDNFWGKTCLFHQSRRLGIHFTSIFPAEGCGDMLRRSWEAGFKIDCDPESGFIFTACGEPLAEEYRLPVPRLSFEQSQEGSKLISEALARKWQCSKGGALWAAMEFGLAPRSDLVVFIDDQAGNVLSVDDFCKRFGIDSLMMHFQPAITPVQAGHEAEV